MACGIAAPAPRAPQRSNLAAEAAATLPPENPAAEVPPSLRQPRQAPRETKAKPRRFARPCAGPWAFAVERSGASFVAAFDRKHLGHHALTVQLLHDLLLLAHAYVRFKFHNGIRARH